MAFADPFIDEALVSGRIAYEHADQWRHLFKADPAGTARLLARQPEDPARASRNLMETDVARQHELELAAQMGHPRDVERLI